MDLLTPREDATYETRFDIDLLTRRLERATQWLREQPQTRLLQIGYFGASTGAAAALQAAATFGASIGAVVSRGGRPDLAMSALERVQSPTLLIVGGLDDIVIDLNREAYGKLKAEKHLAIVRAHHLFEEPGTLQEVARLAADWFKRYLGATASKKTPQTKIRRRTLRFLVDRDPAEAKETGDCFRLSRAPVENNSSWSRAHPGSWGGSEARWCS
jgi:dienelactone hydrolase